MLTHRWLLLAALLIGVAPAHAQQPSALVPAAYLTPVTCDGFSASDGAITAGSFTFTSATAAFTEAAVGKTISIAGAGAAGGSLVTRIAGRSNTTTVRLDRAATGTVSGAVFGFGTDYSAEINAALARGPVKLPAGTCGVASSLSIAQDGKLHGQTRALSKLIWLGAAQGGPIITSTATSAAIENLALNGLLSGSCTSIPGGWRNELVQSSNCTSGSLDKGVLGTVPALNAKADYGAVGDGTTDDTTALTNALAACTLNNPLYLPPGLYVTKAPLTVPAHCRFYGDKDFPYPVGTEHRSTIVANNVPGAFVTTTAVLTLSAYSTLDGIGIQGTSFNSAAENGINIGGSWVQIENVKVRNANQYGIYCTAPSGVYQGVNISQSLIGSNGGTGVLIGGGCSDSSIALSYVYFNGSIGVDFRTQGLRLIGNKIEGNTQGISTFGAFALQAIGNTISENTLEGLLFNGGAQESHSIVGNTFNNNGTAATSGRECHVGATGTVDKLSMSGNTYSTTGAAFSGLAPLYIFCGAPTLTKSTISDALSNQVTGIYRAGSQASWEAAMTAVGSTKLVPGGAVTAIVGLTQLGIGGTQGSLDVASVGGVAADWVRLYALCGTANPPWNTGAGARGLMTCWNKSNSSGETRITWGTGAGGAPDLWFDTWDGTTYTNRAKLTTAGIFTGGLSSHLVSTSTLTKTTDTTLATIPGLSIVLQAGKTYNCQGHLSGVSGAAGGLKVTFINADTLTITSARFNGFTWNGTTAVSNTTVTSLGSNIVASNAIYSDVYIEAAVVANVGGTLAVQAAQNTSDATSTTVLLNSTFSCVRMN